MTLPNHRPIFVLGCPRSGTTLLQQMLHCHRRIALPSETRLVQPAYQRRGDFGTLETAANRREFGDWLIRRPESKFTALKPLEADAVIEEIAAAPPTVGSLLATIFRAYARAHEKARWGDKRPGYFRQVPLLLRMFPDAQFIHLVRDGRDAVASLRSMPWYNGDIYTATLSWREAVQTGDRMAARLGSDTYHQMRYEDLTAEPTATLRTLCAFLGEDYDPMMAESHEYARRTVPAERRWHLRTMEAPNTGRIGAWTGRLADWEVAMIEHHAGAELVRRGYEPSGAPRPSARTLATLRRTAARRMKNRAVRRATDRARRLREPNPVASRLAGSALDTPGLDAPVPETPDLDAREPETPDSPARDA